VLLKDQPDVRAFESVTLYKSNIIRDEARTLGYPFIMFYNGKRPKRECIGMAVSNDLRHWLRYGVEPVIDNVDGISGDPQIVRMGDAESPTSNWVPTRNPSRVGDPSALGSPLWVMHYFGAFWKGSPTPNSALGGPKPKAFDTFACSYDLAHWTKWDGPHLIEPSEPWDETFAHKPWVIRHEDTVYHFYCAVGNRGRVIALATSRPIEPPD